MGELKEIIILVIISLMFCINVSAQSIGANYNEDIDMIDNELIKKSQVQWVRGFVNINRFFLNVKNQEIVGIRKKTIKNWEPINTFLNVKKVKNKEEKVKLILSLKLDFKNRKMGVPDLGTNEAEYLFEAISLFLKNKNVGEQISVLVLGNEPMWETPTEDAEKYGFFLDELIERVYKLKKVNSWNFDIYIGALNKASTTQKHPILKEVLKIAKSNSKIDGLDIHMHTASVSEIQKDLEFIRETKNIRIPLISTEYSMVRAFNEHSKDELGSIAKKYGYSETLKLYELLNMYTLKSSEDNPVNADEFNEIINSFNWYEKNWFTAFYDAFKKYDVNIGTYRLVSKPKSPPLVLKEDNAMWLINAIYQGEILGKDKSGVYNTNPLVYPEYLKIITQK